MNAKTTRRPRLRLVAGVVAVAVATSSGAYAAGAIVTSSKQIKSGVVNSGDIKNGTIRVKDLSQKTVDTLNPAPAPADKWHVVGTAGEPHFHGSWFQYPGYEPASFRKDADGVVTVRGGVTAGGDIGSSDVFELPAGYRPANCSRFVVATTNGFGTESEFGSVTICPDGDVQMEEAGDDRFVSLEGISFSVS
ncbi:hypothetical protein [Nocardioides sp.]|uniref:hypothetical protein n=1 Tax=Nocardioides sp. TaxID=35761 RepID=UPI001A1DE55D|nr:hypothetical protein [Nocardioides sp.]MBJ7358141.1 hypothetical protein [Nocardioides sp.]